MKLSRRVLESVVRSVHKVMLRELAGRTGIDFVLGGACAIGAELVAARLRLLGAEPTVWEGSDPIEEFSHCWVELDGWILDPTWMQFDEAVPWKVSRDSRAYRQFEDRVPNPDWEDWDWCQSPKHVRISSLTVGVS